MGSLSGGCLVFVSCWQDAVRLWLSAVLRVALFPASLLALGCGGAARLLLRLVTAGVGSGSVCRLPCLVLFLVAPLCSCRCGWCGFPLPFVVAGASFVRQGCGLLLVAVLSGSLVCGLVAAFVGCFLPLSIALRSLQWCSGGVGACVQGQLLAVSFWCPGFRGLSHRFSHGRSAVGCGLRQVFRLL